MPHPSSHYWILTGRTLEFDATPSHVSDIPTWAEPAGRTRFTSAFFQQRQATHALTGQGVIAVRPRRRLKMEAKTLRPVSTVTTCSAMDPWHGQQHERDGTGHRRVLCSILLAS